MSDGRLTLNDEATDAATSTPANVRWLVDLLVSADSAVEFADGMHDAIAIGRLAPGTRLPTIRALSAESGLTFRAISEIWVVLRERGLVQTRRRGGTVVAALPGTSAPAGTDHAASGHIDLSESSADVTLLPPLDEGVSAGLRAPDLHSSVRDYVIDDLRRAALPGWPFPVESVTSGGSGAEAALLAVEAVTPIGGTVAIDVPANPGFLGYLRRIGLIPYEVPSDGRGPDPASLRRALEAGASSYLFQAAGPWALDPLPDATRLGELAAVLQDHPDVFVVEDDPVGPLADEPAPTLGPLVPGRVVRVRSFCRAYGVDLRTSITGGPGEVIERLRALRAHGLAVNSRILQGALAHLLESPRTAVVVHAARDRYRTRKAGLAAALQDLGVPAASGPNGQFLWIPTSREADTLIDLAAAGVTAGAGSRSFVDTQSTGFVRLATMRAPDDPLAQGRIAGLVADALHSRLGDRFA
ncbi:aminotransferase class I/II-fold pyridoxal phosphate-dependent enzyme [Microbacterium sp. BWT-B31]|uniref:aminotransferase class I/II-fold pyridoxal phosphate-dependent enzyme n=1 Tax=Microbacterium sp. BWT-B31 TaxID=3232072 RepID=UPI0035277001